MSIIEVILYGTGWCTKTALLSNHLQSIEVNFKLKNVDLDTDAANELMKLYNGNLKFPTVTIGEKFIKNPNIQQLNEFLKDNKLWK